MPLELLSRARELLRAAARATGELRALCSCAAMLRAELREASWLPAAASTVMKSCRLPPPPPLLLPAELLLLLLPQGSAKLKLEPMGTKESCKERARAAIAPAAATAAALAAGALAGGVAGAVELLCGALPGLALAA
jgi:hypothetical protein